MLAKTLKYDIFQRFRKKRVGPALGYLPVLSVVDLLLNVSDSKPLSLFPRPLPALNGGLPTPILYPGQPSTLGDRLFPAGFRVGFFSSSRAFILHHPPPTTIL